MATRDYTGMIFIAAPREICSARFKQIVKHYLPKSSIVLGISKEPYVAGFDNQPQFKMLGRHAVQPVIDKVNAASKNRRIHVLEYSQADLAKILKEHAFGRVLLINGSWQYTFQNHPAHDVLTRSKTPFKYISPFTSEDEAKAYEASRPVLFTAPPADTRMSEDELFALAAEAARQSYDYSFQTGAVLARRDDGGYRFRLAAFNKVVPYQTYALHHGNTREKHASGVHDTTHYDTIHAEMLLLTQALREPVTLKDTALFINLLPCPSCARTLSQTDIAEIVYIRDHSNGYAADLLRASGKTVRRVKPSENKVQ